MKKSRKTGVVRKPARAERAVGRKKRSAETKPRRAPGASTPKAAFRNVPAPIVAPPLASAPAEKPAEVRRGPKIIPVKSAPVAPTAVPTPLAPPTASAPKSETRPVPPSPSSPDHVVPLAPGARPGVRLGRLPPRGADTPREEAQARARASGYAPLFVTPTLPRKPFSPERFREVEALGARLGASVDTGFRKLVRALLEGTATLSTAPRGSGHEAAALVASELLPQPALVVGPDVATLSDLRDQLERASGTGILLNDARGEEPNAAHLSRIASSTVKVVFATPKWLANETLLRTLASVGVSLVTVLEAEDVSTLSRTFSPAHARLRVHLDRLGRPPVFALAPGAASDVRQDVVDALLGGAPTTFDAPAIRANVVLSFATCRDEGRKRALADAMRRLPKPMIVFASTPRDVEAVHGSARALGFSVHRYHEELKTGVRAAEQLQFSMPGDRPILVATSAFSPGAAREEDAEGVPLRYGRRTAKSDIRSMIRFQPPSSVGQLVDELALLGRDGAPAEAVVFHDSTDRSALLAEVESSRPSAEQLLAVGKTLEPALDQGSVTAESLALAARTSLRAVQTVAGLLAGMGLVTLRDGWIRRVAQSHLVSKELQLLAERYATVRTLDARRLAEFSELATHRGCASERVRRLLGDGAAGPCGRCGPCHGVVENAFDPAPEAHRHAPARRFTVTTAGRVAEVFHSDRRTRDVEPLTAKLADFRS